MDIAMTTCDTPLDAFKRHLALMAPVGFVRAEAPPDAALDAPRFIFRQSPTWRDERHNRDLKRVLRNCHQRFFDHNVKKAFAPVTFTSAFII